MKRRERTPPYNPWPLSGRGCWGVVPSAMLTLAMIVALLAAML